VTDTARTQADLLTLFGDVPVIQGRITPQMMRDFIVSVPSLGMSAINVKAAPYSATGDGVADDTAAVKAAIAAAGNGCVYFPPGVYVINETLNIKRALRLMGAGGGGSEVSLDTYGSVLKFPNNIPGI